ncbi:MAG: hypothetical protein ACREBU_12400 [Nitrososphaera sp.]
MPNSADPYFWDRLLGGSDASYGGCVELIPPDQFQDPQAIIRDGFETSISHEFMHNYGFTHVSSAYDGMMTISGGGTQSPENLQPSHDRTMAIQTSPAPKRTWY